LEEFWKIINATQELEIFPKTLNYSNQKVAIEKLRQSLRNWVCWHILTVLCEVDVFEFAAPSTFLGIDSAENGDCFPTRPQRNLFQKLHPKAKLLTRPFWAALQLRDFGVPITMSEAFNKPEVHHIVAND